MKVEAAGANKYAFDVGGGTPETIVADGTDQPGGSRSRLLQPPQHPEAGPAFVFLGARNHLAEAAPAFAVFKGWVPRMRVEGDLPNATASAIQDEEELGAGSILPAL